MGYLKIPNSYKDNTILNFKKVYALEKVHGTSSWVQWNGELSFYSGGEKHENFVKLFDHERLTNFFKSKEYPEGVVVRIHGEAYGGKQQGMKDTYGPTLRFIAFDVKIGDLWLDVPKAEGYCRHLDLDFVPYEYVSSDEESLNHERDRDSVVAMNNGMGTGHIREGIVIRPPFEVRLNSGERLIAKHKRDEFREHKNPRSTLTMSAEQLLAISNAEEVADEWCVPMRLEHVIGQLTRDGVEPQMEDMQKIIKTMVDDIYVEAGDEVVQSREASKAIGTKTVKLFKDRMKSKLKEV